MSAALCRTAGCDAKRCAPMGRRISTAPLGLGASECVRNALHSGTALFWVTLLLALGTGTLFPQGSEDANPQPVIRVTVNLVQLDAVVTDSSGNQITTLRPDDFRVFEDGQPQAITNLSYVRVGSRVSETPATPTGLPNLDSVQVWREQVHRVIAVVVDDLHLSFVNTGSVRKAVRAFVDKDIQPDDLVAILHTSGSMGPLQQFTHDKRLLEAAAERIRYCLSCLNVASDDWGRAQRTTLVPRESTAVGKDAEPTSKDREAASGRENEFIASTAAGTIDSLEYVLQGLRDLPGRKALIYIGEGLPLCYRMPCEEIPARHRWRKLTDLALRSSVVVHAIDARGVTISGLTAADVGGPESPGVQSPIMSNSFQYFESQGMMAQVAKDTGGLFIHETNDLAGGMQKVVDDSSGYYLIGYKPPTSLFRPSKNGQTYHHIRVKVNRPGLHVRSRTGFFAASDADTQQTPPTEDAQMKAALNSPFRAAEINLQLAPQFMYKGHRESVARLWLHIDAKDLTFRKVPDGTTTARVDLRAVTFGDNGEVVSGTDQTFVASCESEQLEVLRREGLNYRVEVPINEPGGYQLRVAVRDAASGRFGSASQFMEIPNLRNGKLVLSSIVLNERGEGEKSPAIRRFEAGDRVAYRVEIYNARKGASGSHKLEGSIQILYEGRVVSTLKSDGIEPLPEAPDRLVMLGAFTINRETPLGNFLIRASVVESDGTKHSSTANRWSDFEVVSPNGTIP